MFFYLSVIIFNLKTKLYSSSPKQKPAPKGNGLIFIHASL